jgi:hypothetical protein
MSNPVIESPLEDDKKLGAEHVEFREQDVETGGGVHRRFNANHQMDDAAQLLAQAGGHVDVTEEDRKRVLRKIDLWVCVPMCIVYCIQSLDKGSITYAAVFNLQADTGLVGAQYSWLSRWVRIGVAMLTTRLVVATLLN